MKKLFLTLVLSVLGMMAWADDNAQNCVIVEFQNGETMAIALAHQPKVTFENEDLVLTAEDVESRYARTDIHRFYFEMTIDGIKVVESSEKPSSGDLYDTNGRKVGHYDGTLSTANLPFGVYVVKTTSGKSFKIIRK